MTTPSEAQRAAAGRLMLEFLLQQHVPNPDAEKAVQAVLERVGRDPILAAKVASLDQHASYIRRVALSAYLMTTLSEQQMVAARSLMLESLLQRYVPPTEAEDAVQCVLERAWHDPVLAAKLAALPEDAPYIRRAALNAHLGALRAERRRREREDLYSRHQASAAMAPTTAVVEHYGPQLLALADAVGLTPKQRQYLRLLFVEGVSVQQIASATGTQPAAVEAVLDRAKTAIQDYLAARVP